MRNRDDFSKRTKEVIARRAGYRCSAPNCRRGTLRPDPANAGDAINQGVAAHIRAASLGGARYDAGITSEERRSATNGIWLCQVCAKVVDDSPEAFPVEALLAWKDYAEKLAARDARATPDEISNLIAQIQETHQILV